MATAQVIDFTKINYNRDPLPVRPQRSRSGQLKVMSRNQLRARARRGKVRGPSSPEWKILYKPVEEWDPEELARGRPRSKAGTFAGRAPEYIPRELHEEAMSRFRSLIREGMNANANVAIEVVRNILENTEVDDDGKPRIPPSTKLDAAKWLVDHVIGKPKQRVETDISVKLQGILASSIVMPGTLPAVPNAKELVAVEEAEWSDEV